MTVKISRRALIRSICFLVAIITVLSILAFNFYNTAKVAQRTLEYQYLKSIDDLTQHVDNINSTLSKVSYTKTPAMLASLSSKLWRESGLAKESLSGLPIEYLNLQNTNKFLSQVGDYCVSISKGFANGEPITKEQRQNLKKLNEYCGLMLNEVLVVSDAAQTGSLNLTKVTKKINNNMQGDQTSPNVAEGFADFEEGFTAYPTLIYDGPFSDHIMQKEPEYLKSAKAVSLEQARKLALSVTGVADSSLKNQNDEDSKMPSYCFSSDATDISITKKGGYLSYMLKSRSVEQSKLSVETALKKADEFVKTLAINNLQYTYYETANNVMTVNYAAKQGDVLLYTDLIKVSVALDNGEVTAYDARGYLTNHHKRDNLQIKLTKEQAQKSVSEELNVEKTQLCVIPTGGLNEKLCYEFKCKSKDKKDVLVYINATTGAEEQILILMIDENGQLTI